MRHNKTFTCLILVSTLICSMLSGCGQKSNIKTGSSSVKPVKETADEPAETVPLKEAAIPSGSEEATEPAEEPDFNGDLSEEPSEIPESKEETDDRSWATAYLDYLSDFGGDHSDYSSPEYRSYDYIYVNDDNIPELVIRGQDEATGNIILTCNNGFVDELQTSRLYFDYQEKGNLLRNSDGHMGGYYDYIYTIENNRWKLLYYGEYYVEDNSVRWEDSDLIYEWNGKRVSMDDYDIELEKVYDTRKAKPGEGVLSLFEITEKLEMDASGVEKPFIEDDTYIHDYELIKADVTWEEALEECKKRGGYLARLNTNQEYYYLQDLILKEGIDTTVFWIGGKLNPDDSHYYWFDGEKYLQAALDVDRYYQYNWLNGEPSFKGTDQNGDPVDENCICMFKVNGSWEWNDVPNDITPFYRGKMGYICEKE